MIWLIGLGLLAAVFVWLALRPSLQTGQNLSLAQTARLELEEERDSLYAGIRELERDHASGLIDALDYKRLRLRDETRAALILERLEDLPPIPIHRAENKIGSAKDTRPVWPVALGSLAALVVVGVLSSAFLVWPLQRIGLREDERKLYDASRQIPALEAQLNREALANPQTGASQKSLLEFGQVTWDAKDYERAGKVYASILRVDKRQPTALTRYGSLLFFAGRNEEALELLSAATTIDPKQAEAWLTMGNIYFGALNNPKKALESWQRYKSVAGSEASARVADLMAAAETRLLDSDPGAKLFAQNCAGCHGAQAQGLVGPNLKTSAEAKDAAFVKQQLENGSKDGRMPAFPRFTAAELGHLIQHVTVLK
jgi:mono/diheme cytochrome c family protein